MPQMAPMWWTLIMMLSTTLLLLMIMINYFMTQKNISTNSNNETKNFNWKW